MTWISFDVETAGDLQEYALQPWRVKDGQAWIRTWSETSQYGNFTTIAPDDPAEVAALLRKRVEAWIAAKATVCVWNGPFDVAMLAAYGLSDLIKQVRWLDGMLLWKHLAVPPEYDVPGTKRKKFGLKEAVAEFFPDYAGYDDDIDFDGDILTLLHYNAVDSWLTRALTRMFYVELEKNPQALKAAMIESHCIPYVAIANYEGMEVLSDGLEKMDEALKKQAEESLAALEPHGATEKILKSPTQLRKLLFEDWGLKPIKHGKTGPSTDKETLNELSLVDDRVVEIGSFREAVGNRKKFCTNIANSVEYNNDSRTHPLARVFGTYCVPGDVEVLTPTGWVRLDQWAGGDIAQVEAETLNIFFAHADRHEQGIVSSWVRWASKQGILCDFTPNHDVPHYEQRGFWRVREAGELLQTGSQVAIPVAGHLTTTPKYTPAQTRVLCMAQADGWFFTKSASGGEGLKLTFVKRRKIDRAKWVLRQAGIPFNEYTYSARGYSPRTSLTIGVRSLPTWLGSWCKQVREWVLDTDIPTFVSEVVHWDGSHHSDGGVKFSSIDEETVEWVVTAASLAGHKATKTKPRKKTTYDDVHCCHISHASPRRVVHPKKHMSVVHDKKEAFCPVTTTGFWLARSKGKIFVTGNSGRFTYTSKQDKNKAERQIGFALHQMKRSAEYRQVIKAPAGHTIVELDAASQEYRWMAILSGDETMRSLCMPGEDPHSYMGSQVMNVPYREIQEGAKEDKQLGKIRQMGKVGNLSLQYRTSARKLLSTARTQHKMMIDFATAERIWRAFRMTYPGVPKYWDRQIAHVKRYMYVDTLAGRRVTIPRRLLAQWEWSVESTSINYPVQGTGADQKYLALSVLRPLLKQMVVQFAFDLHDGLYFFVPDDVVWDFIPAAKYLLDNMPYEKAWGFTPPIPLPWDVKVGKTWGGMKELK